MSGRIILAGVDEVGRGPLAGPVVAACVHIPDTSHSWLEAITDSKKTSMTKRNQYAVNIREHCVWGLGEATVEEIDEINILQATFLAMKRAVSHMTEQFSVHPDTLAIDGNFVPKGLPCPAEAIIKGDSKVKEISCASILAKVHRDTMMQELAKEHPMYEWHSNAGYGTKAHLTALQNYGCTPHHRRSFAPVRAITEAV